MEIVNKSHQVLFLYFHNNFSGNDCHLIYEQLLTQAFKIEYEPKIDPKSIENYVSVQVGGLRFLDPYKFLSSSLDNLINSLDCFPIMDSTNFEEGFLKKKLAYPYEYFNLDSFQEPINLTKENFWSLQKQETPPDEGINRTQEVTKKFSLKTGVDLTMFYLQMDVLQLADVFENFVQTSTEDAQLLGLPGKLV